MSSTAWPTVNATQQATSLAAQACCGAHTPTAGLSPIDAFLEDLGEVLALGSPSGLAANDALGRVLLLGVVAGTESYFRAVLAAVLRLCPLAQERAAEQPIPYGALSYYSRKEIESALFEMVSFARAETILSTTRNIVGVNLPRRGPFDVLLEQFEQICHLRHACVHAHGHLSSRNAASLGLPGSTPQRVVLRFAELQNIGAVVSDLVRAYNTQLFEGLCQLWINHQVLTGTWSTDWVLFRPLHGIFFSSRDAAGDPDARKAYAPVGTSALSRVAT